jgi:hypothetical protein
MFDLDALETGSFQYERQIRRIKEKTGFPDAIEETTSKAVESVANGVTSFVIYGEPQSGKTEMMICLTARLLDAGFGHIVVLVNDNVDLQNQNLERFRTSGLSPAPKSVDDVKMGNALKPNVSEVIFCKKNKNDLEALLDKMRNIKHRLVIDDEADFATPNSQINKSKQSRINELVGELRDPENGGIYIGVTATPARLDLNNTFQNEKSSWVYFRPYPQYSGHQVFFSQNENEEPKFELVPLPDDGDKQEFLLTALTRFVVNVSYLNLYVNTSEQNYCMLIHTSGNKEDHVVDWKVSEQFFEELGDNTHRNFNKRYEAIAKDAESRYGVDPNEILKYVLANKARKAIKLINSNTKKENQNIQAATNPQTTFTVAIGGNIVSRGVTFNNLLSMFFTRTAQKIQQDTYIQRARMFGNRTGYLRYFELHIPKSLYRDWFEAFAYHGVSMSSIASGNPIWLESKQVKAVAGNSIDKKQASIEKGEISFEIFDLNDRLISATKQPHTGIRELDSVLKLIPNGIVSPHVLDFVKSRQPNGDASVVFHSSRQIQGSDNIDEENIIRDRGFYGGQDYKKFPDAVHHFMIFYNSMGRGRVIYSYRESEKSIRFIKVRRSKS